MTQTRSATNQRRNNAKPTPHLLKVRGSRETNRLFSSQHCPEIRRRSDATPTLPRSKSAPDIEHVCTTEHQGDKCIN